MKYIQLSILILCSLTSAGFNLQAEEKPAPSKTPEIVVLDMETVFATANIFSVRYEQFNKEVKEAQASWQAEVEAVKSLENQQKITGRSSPQYAELAEQIEVGKFKIKLSDQRVKAQLEKKQFILVKDNVSDLRKHLAAYCEEKGHKVVLRSIGDSLNSRTGQQLRQELTQLNALYAAPENDITEDFIGWLNAKVEVPKEDKGDAKIEVME